jgi:hypothetical protein
MSLNTHTSIFVIIFIIYVWVLEECRINAHRLQVSSLALFATGRAR